MRTTSADRAGVDLLMLWSVAEHVVAPANRMWKIDFLIHPSMEADLISTVHKNLKVEAYLYMKVSHLRNRRKFRAWEYLNFSHPYECHSFVCQFYIITYIIFII